MPIKIILAVSLFQVVQITTLDHEHRNFRDELNVNLIKWSKQKEIRK